MKKLLFLVLILFSFSLNAQNERIEIKGKIKVPIGAEAAGITVYNLVSHRGTVTNDDGAFEIDVKLNDSLAISAVQYQKFIVIIDQGVLDSKRLNITVREAVNELEEVIVRPYDLSGNVSVDIQKVKVFVDLLDMDSEDIVNNPSYPPARPPIKNIAMDDPYVKNGLNFVNIFKAVFDSDSSKKNYSKKPKKDVETKVRELYEDEFFKQYINIKKENIGEFMAFAKSNGLNDKMMQKGHELDLIEFLIEQGKLFKLKKKKD